MANQTGVPSTPRVIAPSPTPSEQPNGSYFAPLTRSATTKRTPSHAKSNPTIQEDSEGDAASSSDSSLEKRARTRSRSPRTFPNNVNRRGTTAPVSPMTSNSSAKPDPTISTAASSKTNGHLAPPSPFTDPSRYWRELSRSPSPLGLIPIHRHWRSFVHRHEIPRKFLHVSIGFVTMHLYTRGTSPNAIHPWLLTALVPIASLDYLRHTFPGLNRVYIRAVGALMRESEVDGYNGVIWYLLGAWAVLRFFPKDVGVMSVLLLSWCDTAASTFGRLYGRYTPRIRRGKSLAGSAAAAVVGFLTAELFYSWVVPRYPRGAESFMFQGTLGLPAPVATRLGVDSDSARLSPWLSVTIVSVWSGLVASLSEVVDLFSWDDNATIPILSGLGLWGFYKIFAR